MIRNLGLTRLAVVSVTLVALSSAQAAAQQPASPASGPVRPGTPEFGRLVGGRQVTVTMIDGKQYKGSFTSSGAFAGSFTPVPTGAIVKVERVTNHALRGLAIGLGLGVGAGFLTYSATCENECSPAAFLTMTGIGAGIGAAIGAAHKKQEVLYDGKRSMTRTMSFAPIVSKSRKGAMVSMTWR